MVTQFRHKRLMGKLFILHGDHGDSYFVEILVDDTHLGWEGSGSANRTNPEIQARNIGYALEALGAAARLGCTRFLFSGSQAEYGIADGLMREDSPCHPVSEYGKDKLEVCRRVGERAAELGITYLHARIFSVYGPGDHPWSLDVYKRQVLRNPPGFALYPLGQGNSYNVSR